MKVHELVDTFGWDVGYVEVVVRERGCSKWIYAYRYGHQAFVGKNDKIKSDKALERAREYRSLLVPPGKEYIVDTHIGIVGDECLMKVGNKKLPKKVAELEICSWRCMRSLAPKAPHDSTDHYAILIDAFPEGYVQEPEPKQEEQDTQLDGQMNITEWMEGKDEG